jgi:hypothetical protein
MCMWNHDFLLVHFLGRENNNTERQQHIIIITEWKWKCTERRKPKLTFKSIVYGTLFIVYRRKSCFLSQFCNNFLYFVWEFFLPCSFSFFVFVKLDFKLIKKFLNLNDSRECGKWKKHHYVYIRKVLTV